MSEYNLKRLWKESNYAPGEKFRKFLRNEHDIIKSGAEIKRFINDQNTTQAHKPIIERKDRSGFILADTAYQSWQCDLIDYKKYARKNKGCNWCFVAIDVYTRFAVCVPVKTKSPNDTVLGLKSIPHLNHMKRITHDMGKEWEGVFDKFVKTNNIVSTSYNSKIHRPLAIIDRFCRTLKSIIARHMTDEHTTNWVNVIDRIVSQYNNSPHASLGEIKPKDAANNKRVKLINDLKQGWNLLYYNVIIPKKYPIHVGSLVRTIIQKNDFSKGYEQTYSKTVHTVTEKNGMMFTLDNGTEWYIKDLQLVSDNAKKIETREKDTAEKKAKQQRKLRKEGLS